MDPVCEGDAVTDDGDIDILRGQTEQHIPDVSPDDMHCRVIRNGELADTLKKR